MAQIDPTLKMGWASLTSAEVSAMLKAAPVRWWISGGVALDLWLGAPVRERRNIDVSVVRTDLRQLLAFLPENLEVYAVRDEELVSFSDVALDDEVQPVYVWDRLKAAWVLRINVEDGAPRAWVYKRDPRLQLPWDQAVLEIEGLPVGAPEIQLVWKALRPRPEDEDDMNAVVVKLTAEARAWYERAILAIHPHSTWAIHVRSPFAPAKASWNKKPKN